MRIQVYDSGCSNCKALVHRIQCAITELGGQCVVEEIQDAEMIAAAGVNETPAWGIGTDIMSTGGLPSLAQIKADLLAHCQRSNGNGSRVGSH